MAIISPSEHTTNGRVAVSVRDNEVVLNDFHETDPEVFALAHQADHPEAAMHNAIQVGARAIKLAQISQDTHVVEAAFAELRGSFDGKLDDTLRQVGDASAALFDADDGAVPKALDGFRGQLDSLLGETFDPDSKRSVIGKFDDLVRGVRNEDRKAIAELLDPGNDQSPLHRLHRDVTKAVRDEAERTHKLVAELSEKIAVNTAEAGMFEKTALKGSSFEDAVHASVSDLVTPFGDTAEFTGREVGCAGTKKGDEVVTLNVDDTRTSNVRYTLECKDQKVGHKATTDELDAAMRNRDAEVAIAVFSSQANAPTTVPFSYNGDKAIVVFDKHDADPAALRLATMWARWTARRKLADGEREVDVEAIETLLDEAGQALTRHTTIKRCHSVAAKKIDEATSQVSQLIGDVHAVLDRLRDEVAH
jgi:hypothetical protein